MTTSGVSFEKETKALSKRVLDFFERVRYAYLSAKENPKEYGKKWKSTVKSIREEYDGLGEFASELKENITEKELFDDKAFEVRVKRSIRPILGTTRRQGSRGSTRGQGNICSVCSLRIAKPFKPNPEEGMARERSKG